jgi:hypothetical protein
VIYLVLWVVMPYRPSRLEDVDGDDLDLLDAS